MSEREFELYVSLLGRLLRLDTAQREQIADELRDHFEERLEELIRLGRSRADAIQQAVEEFGDAAGLAADFTHIARRTKRRLIMRCTFGTVAGLAAAMLMAVALWPDNTRVAVNPRAVAQQLVEIPLGKEDGINNAKKVSDDQRTAVEKKLDTRIESVDFSQKPLTEVVAFLSDKIGVDILLNRGMFAEIGMPLDCPIDLQIRHTPVTARTVLELVLEQLGMDEMGYTVRDGLIYVTSKFSPDEIRVYNCRDLMSKPAGGDAAEGLPGGPSVARSGGLGPRPGGGIGGGIGGDYDGGEGGFGGGFSADRDRTGLAGVIMNTVHPDTWSDMGGSGTIQEFNGLLIIKHSQAVHREIQQLLDQIREVAAEKGKQQ